MAQMDPLDAIIDNHRHAIYENEAALSDGRIDTHEFDGGEREIDTAARNAFVAYITERWIPERLDVAAHEIAKALDRRADQLGRGQAARMCRALATQQHLLYLAICGADELRADSERD